MANNPGLESQSSARTTFRIAGIVLAGVGLVMLVVGVADLFSTMNTDSFEGPEHFWMAFVGLPLLAVGGWCLQAGFMGAAGRYVAGETVPVVKDSLEYLTDGQGLAGLGRSGTGRFCTQCGSEQGSAARFCGGCGSALA